jgi:tetratricopeptide (TPR) repeat protein
LPWTLPLALVLAGALCYANSLRGHFVFADENFGQADDFSLRSRPLYWATIAVNRWISPWDPLGYHLFNIAVHLLAGLALLGLLRRTLALLPGAVAPGRQAWFAFAAALLWLVHPLQTNAVTYLAQRTESLSGLFALAALLAFVRSATAPSGSGMRGARSWSALALAAFAAAVATKEIAITLPVLILLYDRTFLAGSFAGALRQRRAFYTTLAGTAVILGVIFIAPILLADASSAGFRVIDVSPAEYARSQPAVILHYLALSFWPRGLCLDYMWPIAREARDWVPHALALAVLAAATAWALARRSWIGMAGAWFFVLLAPTSSVIPIQDLAFEHRMYLPLAAVVVLVLAALWSAIGRISPRPDRLRTAVPLALALALGAATFDRNRDYSSAVRLWSTVIECAPHNWRAQLGLGTAYVRAGRPAEGLPALVRSAELAPLPNTFVLIGQAHARLGELPKAIAAFDRADALRRRHSETLLHRGQALLKRGDLARATADLEAAVALGTDAAATALYNLGITELRAGDPARAERRFRAALEHAPHDVEARIALAQVLVDQRRFADAAEAVAPALERAPENESAHSIMGSALQALGRHAEALVHFEQALALPRPAPPAPPVPPLPWEHHNRAEALNALGRTEEALAEYRAAMRLGPRFVPPRLRLAQTLLARTGPDAAALREALAAASEAARLTDQRQPEVLATLAEAHAAVGERAAAVAALERALATHPEAALAARLQQRLAELRQGSQDG